MGERVTELESAVMCKGCSERDAVIAQLQLQLADADKELRETTREASREMRDVATEAMWEARAEAEGHPPGCY